MKIREQYKDIRNVYVRIRRVEERKFAKDEVEKCEEKPKLFYKYKNGKMTNRETTDKLVKGGRIYDTAEVMKELMNGRLGLCLMWKWISQKQ